MNRILSDRLSEFLAQEAERAQWLGSGPQNPRARLQAVHVACAKLIAVKSLQTIGELVFRGRSDYLEALIDDWTHNPGPYSLVQRVSIAVEQGLCQPNERARGLVLNLVGNVPFVGSGAVPSDLGLYHPSQSVLVADSLVTGLLGLLPRPWNLDTSALFFEALDQVLAPEQAAPWSRLLEEARRSRVSKEVTVVDPQCGSAARLAAHLVVAHETGQLDEETLGRTQGFTDDANLAVWARSRLVSVWILVDPRGVGLPLPDFGEVVKVGTTLRESAHPPREDRKTEFKAGLDWNPRTGGRDAGLLRGCARTVAAFLNGEGGELWIGVADDGSVVGIDSELAATGARNPCDLFEAKLREALKTYVEPVPLNLVDCRFQDVDGKTVCRVSVRPRPGVTYFVSKDPHGRTCEEIPVRDGNRTVHLVGRARDQFVLSRMA